jgi:FKBP-type peptidyl-prolyl cis-trans isomerase
MKRLLLIAVAGTLAFSSCGGQHKGGTGLKTDQDSLSYYIGVDLGYQMKQADSTMNLDALFAGIDDVFKNNKLEEHSREVVNNWIRDYYMNRLPAKNLKEAEDFLAQVAQENKNIQKEIVKVGDKDVEMLYEIVQPGNEEKPTNDRDKVKVKYEGTFINGSLFDGRDSMDFPLNAVVKGWTEGLKLIGKGGEIKLYLHPDLAYGPYGRPPKIGPNTALVFDISLYDFTPADTTANAATPQLTLKK